jgi:hypothetical protein
MLINKEELAWAGGLFEGEGSFYSTSKSGSNASISMTDLDSLERFQKAVGLPIKIKRRKLNPEYKPVYEWRTGKFEYVQALGAMLWNYLGQRRKRQVVDCFKYKAASVKSRNGVGLGKTTCPNGHLYDEKNTYIDKRGTRICRTCRNKSSLNWFKNHKEEHRTYKRKYYHKMKHKNERTGQSSVGGDVRVDDMVDIIPNRNGTTDIN